MKTARPGGSLPRAGPHTIAIRERRVFQTPAPLIAFQRDHLASQPGLASEAFAASACVEASDLDELSEFPFESLAVVE